MHSIPVFRLLALIFWLTPLGGCQTVKEIFGFGVMQPKVKVLSMAVRKVTLSELDLLVQLKVDNPNSFDLEFNSLAYQVAIDEAPLANGEYKSSIKIPEESSLKIELPLTVSTQNAFSVVQKIFNNPSHDAQVQFSALVSFKSLVGPLEFEFKESRPLLKH
jgi:LEA14-like dessication related protein